MRFLETKDGLERNLMVVLASEISKVRKDLDMSLATAIANQVGKLFKT